MTIAGDDNIRSGSDGGGDDLIVVLITRHGPRNNSGRHADGKRGVEFQSFLNRSSDSPQALVKMRALQNRGEFGQQGRGCGEIDASVRRGFEQAKRRATPDQRRDNNIGIKNGPHRPSDGPAAPHARLGPLR